MFDTIDREKLESKLEDQCGFTLIEVLEEEEYEQGHIPGAINIPLEEIGREVKDKLETEQEIIVYCADEDCGASPAAAEKLDKLGFENVRDYEGGKKDWVEAGNRITTEN
ncbi:rhodanese-like domain-containing protein [Candidatus Bipolaricaulota bacterium]|nr:rhodanese-like domain-containing protein [Candidatus Bipolaricaulota bacterium]